MKKPTKNSILEAYMDFVLMNNSKPKSVYSFAKENKFDEQEFYNYFNSFEVLEKSIFESFFENALQVLEKSEDYSNYDNRNKLLSFYFTFFEVLTANRSYVVYALQSNKNKIESLKTLAGLRTKFVSYIKALDLKTIDLQNEKLNNLQNRSIEETAWIQLLMTIKFWLEDSSPSFEKTDLLIEKTIKAGFDLMENPPLKSVFDLGKFLLKEKLPSM